MNKSKVDTVVSLIPFPGDPENQPNNYKINTSSVKNKTRLALLVSEKEEEWHVDNCIEFHRQSTKERESLIHYALAGFSTCALIMSQGDAESLYERRERDLQLTLQLLQEKINNADNQIKIEYACIGIRDVYCFDLRKDKVIANESILRSGLEHYMKKANDVNDIWKVVKDGSKIPFVLSIRLTDIRQKTQGILELFDLLRPKTVDQDKRNSYLLHDSFTHLVRMIQIMSNPQHQGDSQLHIKDYALTFLLAKKLAGHTKLTVFTYLNDFVPKKNLEDSAFLLNLTEQLGRLTSYIFPNEHSAPTKQLAELKTKNQRLRELLQIEQAQVVYLEAARTEALVRPSTAEMDLRLKLLDEKTNQHLLEQQLEELQLDLLFVQRDRLAMENSLNQARDDCQQMQGELIEMTARYEELNVQLQQFQAQPPSNEQQEKYDMLEKAYQEAMEASAAKIKELKAKYRQNTMTMRDEVLRIQQEAEEAIEKHAQSEKEMKAKYDELKASYEEEILENQDSKRTIAEVKEDLREELEQELMERLEQQIAYVVSEGRAKLNEVKGKYKKRIEELKASLTDSANPDIVGLHETIDTQDQKISDLNRTIRQLEEELTKANNRRVGRPRKTPQQTTDRQRKKRDDTDNQGLAPTLSFMPSIHSPNSIASISSPTPFSRSPSPLPERAKTPPTEPPKRRKYRKRVKAPLEADETHTHDTIRKRKKKETALEPQAIDDDFMETVEPPPPKVVKRGPGRPRKRVIENLPSEHEKMDDIKVIDKHRLTSPEVLVKQPDQQPAASEEPSDHLDEQPDEQPDELLPDDSLDHLLDQIPEDL